MKLIRHYSFVSSTKTWDGYHLHKWWYPSVCPSVKPSVCLGQIKTKFRNLSSKGSCTIIYCFKTYFLISKMVQIALLWKWVCTLATQAGTQILAMMYHCMDEQTKGLSELEVLWTKHLENKDATQSICSSNKDNIFSPVLSDSFILSIIHMFLEV